MRSKKLLIAVLVTTSMGFGMFLAFSYWKSRALYSPQLSKIQLINKMEQEGVPDFEFNQSGRSYKLSDFKGKVIILNFWASWCGPCVEEIPSMIRLIEKAQGKIVLVAISQDQNENEMKAFLKSFPGINRRDIYLGWDQQRTIGEAYSVERLPESFIIGTDFKLKRKIIGTIDWDTEDAMAYLNRLDSTEK